MARSHAKVKTALWANADFLALSMGAQWLFHVILEQPTLSLCGVVPLTVARWASFAHDVRQRDVRNWIAALVGRGFIVVDEASEEAWVRSFTKHDGVLRQPNVVVAMAKDYGAIHSEAIRRGFIRALPEPFPEPDAKGFGEGFVKGLPEPFRDALLTRGRAGADSNTTTDTFPADLTSGTTNGSARVPLPLVGRRVDEALA